MITSENCFDCPEFVTWWNQVEDITMMCADDGWQLDLMIELHQDKVSVNDAAEKMLEEKSLALAEYWDSIPSWA